MDAKRHAMRHSSGVRRIRMRDYVDAMGMTETHDPTEFTCRTCGSEVILKTRAMFTSAYPAGKVRDRRYACRRDSSHDVGPLTAHRS